MARKVKVLCFHPALAPYRVDFFNLLAASTDFEMAVLMENLGNQKLNQNVIRAQAHFKYRMFTKGFELKGRSIRFGIRKLLRETKPEVVLSYEASPITLFLCVLRRFSNWKIWTSMDEAAVTISARHGIRAWMRDFVLRHVDGVVVPSEEALEAYREIVVSRQSLVVSGPRFAVVPIIHDTAAIRKNEKAVIEAGKSWRAGLPKEWQKVLLFVGRLAPVKNLSWLISQIPHLPREVGLVLLGDGPEREALEEQIVALHLENRVVFDGKHEGDDVYARMSAADALVLVSSFEPYGAVVPEAMQWGTPCLVRDTCGCKELIVRHNGVVYRDESDFSNALRQTLLLKKGADSILPVHLDDAVKKLVEALES